jgi:hypothetical protein
MVFLGRVKMCMRNHETTAQRRESPLEASAETRTTTILIALSTHPILTSSVV